MSGPPFGQPSNGQRMTTLAVVFCDTLWVMPPKEEILLNVPVRDFEYVQLVETMACESDLSGEWLRAAGCSDACDHPNYRYKPIDVRHRVLNGDVVGEFKIIFSHETKNENPSRHQLDGFAYHLAGRTTPEMSDFPALDEATLAEQTGGVFKEALTADSAFSFRDACAIAAMQGLILVDWKRGDGGTSKIAIADIAFNYADAMVAERDRRDGA